MSEKCRADVRVNTRFPQYRRCTNVAMLDGYCNVHHPGKIKERQEKREAGKRPSLLTSAFARIKKLESELAQSEAARKVAEEEVRRQESTISEYVRIK